MFELEDIFADSLTTTVYLYATASLLGLCAIAALAVTRSIGTGRHLRNATRHDPPERHWRQAA